MGAEFQTYKVKSTRKNLTKTVDELRSSEAYDYGHAGYTGTIAEDNGNLQISSIPRSLDDAENYIDNSAEKWSHSIAVPIEGHDDLWLVGGVYSC